MTQITASSDVDFASLQSRIEQLEQKCANLPDPNKFNLLVFSGDRDRLLAAFNMATGAAACGYETSMFFTFWAAAALRRCDVQASGKNLVERMFGWLLPKNIGATRLSRMDFAGIGRKMMCNEMKQKGVADLEELLALSAEFQIKLSVCDASLKIMGIKNEELIDYDGMTVCGVATFLESCSQANTTMFV